MSDETAGGGASFNPRDYFRYLKGGRNNGQQEYLDVKWKLLWFRERYPQGRVTTELIRLDDTIAVFRATAWTGDGGEHSGHGHEYRSQFEDYIEKSETRAIGRALGGLGFGPQFAAPDLEAKADDEYRAAGGGDTRDERRTGRTATRTVKGEPEAIPDDPAQWTGEAAFWRNQIDEAVALGTIEALERVTKRCIAKRPAAAIVRYLDDARAGVKLGPVGDQPAA